MVRVGELFAEQKASQPDAEWSSWAEANLPLSADLTAYCLRLHDENVNEPQMSPEPQAPATTYMPVSTSVLQPRSEFCPDYLVFRSNTFVIAFAFHTGQLGTRWRALGEKHDEFGISEMETPVPGWFVLPEELTFEFTKALFGRPETFDSDLWTIVEQLSVNARNLEMRASLSEGGA